MRSASLRIGVHSGRADRARHQRGAAVSSSGRVQQRRDPDLEPPVTDRLRVDDQWNGVILGAPPAITDTSLSGGRVGFGSFVNYGRARHYPVVGTAATP